MTKKLLYYFSNEFIRDSITPTKKHIPSWYKMVPSDSSPSPVQPITKTIKNCMPFLDSFTTGYIIETNQDFRVTQVDGSPMFQWNITSKDTLYIQKREHQPIPAPTGYHQDHFVWSLSHIFKTPKDYSLLLTHPLNRTDLPFLSMSAIIDANQGIGGGNYPFFLKQGFEGIIPTGTPIIQVIPIKQESWEIEHSETLSRVQAEQDFLTNRVIKGWYKHNIWRKKEYK
jgi:hypothetical protein